LFIFLSVPAALAIDDEEDEVDVESEYHSGRMAKASDFKYRQIWTGSSISLAHHIGNWMTHHEYFVVNPKAGKVNAPKLIFGSFGLTGQTYSPGTNTISEQNRMAPVIFNKIANASLNSKPPYEDSKANALVFNSTDGKTRYSVRVKGRGRNLRILVKTESFFTSGGTYSTTYGYFDTLIYEESGRGGKPFVFAPCERQLIVGPRVSAGKAPYLRR